MKFAKLSVCCAIFFAVATLITTQSQPANSATVYNLFDHPDGNANPPPYGLRVDGIEYFYQSSILGNVPSVGISDTWLFSFGEPDTSNTTLTLNDAEDLITIQGTLFGGRDANNDSSGYGSVDLFYTYDVFNVGVFNGVNSFEFVNGSGTLKFNEQIQSIAMNQVFNLVNYGPNGLYRADGHRLNDFCPDSSNELCQRHVGRDWIGLVVDPGDTDVFHTNYQDFLYTGSLVVIPLPAALPLFLTALAGLGGLAYRRRKTAAA